LTLLWTGTQDLTLVDATDIDSSAGQPIYSERAVLSNTINWSVLGTPLTISSIF
jgi:hypothetical protein